MGKSLITNQLLENKITFLMVYFVLLWYGKGHLLWDIYRIFMQYGIYVRFFSLIYAKNLVFSILYYTNPEIPSLYAIGLPLDSRPECRQLKSDRFWPSQWCS